jgi:hypothetical protein
MDYKNFFFSELSEDYLRKIATDESQLKAYRLACWNELNDRKRLSNE